MTDLRKLRHATVLADECSFARAAEKLHVTQSALSQSIARLEEEIGLTLFDRNRSGVAVTTVGKNFIAKANKLLQHARGFEHDMSMLRGCLAGNVAFGMGPLPAVCFLPELLSYALREYPGLNVQAEVNNAEDLLEHLEAERLEFLIADQTNFDLDDHFIVRPLMKMPLTYFVRSGHPAAALKHLRSTDLHNYPLLSAKGSNRFERQLFASDSTKELPRRIISGDYSVLIQLATETDAIIVASFEAVKKEYAAGTLVELKLRQPKTRSANLAIVSLKHRSLSPAATLLIERLYDLTRT